MFGFLYAGRWQNRTLMPILFFAMALFVCSIGMAQVTAADFKGIDWTGVDASAFQALDYLVDTWEVKADKATLTVVADAYRDCACDLKELIEIKTPKPKPEDLLVLQQDFGQRPPVPVSPEFEKKYPQPAPQTPVQVPQPTQKQVQAPVYNYPVQAVMACGMQTQAPIYTNYSSGSRWRLFGGRRASGGGFRLFGRRGGC